MTRIYYNKNSHETTFDIGTALSWAGNGERVSEYHKATEFGGD
jgi:hypothetical protein